MNIENRTDICVKYGKEKCKDCKGYDFNIKEKPCYLSTKDYCEMILGIR